jgi:hypothetical protein
MIGRLLFLACLLLPLHVAAQEGRVLDAATRLPIRDAVVSGGADSAATDGDGRYRLGGPARTVQARAIGYGRAAASVPAGNGPVPPLLLTPIRPRALYLSVYGIGSASLREAALQLLAGTELNALVIDIKGDRGLVPYPSQVAEATLCGARQVTTVRDMHAMVAQLRQSGVYLIARIVAFKDDLLATAHPEWAVKNSSGELFRDNEHQAWIDPFQRAAWPYLLDLAEEAAAMGFDEIQFDYVRFPDKRGLQFAMPNTEESRVDAITGFLRAARQRLRPHNVFLAVDVFGYTAWNSNDTYIGQALPALADVVDYISPMLYPSGFQFGIPGVPDPVQQPAKIVLHSLQRAAARAAISPLRFRPWLQAFRDYAFDHRQFDAQEIRSQIDAADMAGSDGWMLWNPHNTYSADGLRPR